MFGTTGGQDAFVTYLTPDIFLPIELLSFTAKCESNNVIIYWATASEINNDYFEMQGKNGILEERNNWKQK